MFIVESMGLGAPVKNGHRYHNMCKVLMSLQLTKSYTKSMSKNAIYPIDKAPQTNPDTRPRSKPALSYIAGPCQV